MQRLERTRHELSDFLRRHREALSPLDVGLPGGGRRRTPGLRREEVAALAGVGLTWYTWLEQGRDISVSAPFLDALARVLRLDETERHHLFLLAQHRPPSVAPRQNSVCPDFVRKLIDDLPDRPAHVLNFCWDVIGWNTASDTLFGFSDQPADRRNMLWMLFSGTALSRRIENWEQQAPRIVASFRRDFAESPDGPEMTHLVDALMAASPPFSTLWKSHDVHGLCQGTRSFLLRGDAPDADKVTYSHATFRLDADPHLRLVIYQPCPNS